MLVCGFYDVVLVRGPVRFVQGFCEGLYKGFKVFQQVA